VPVQVGTNVTSPACHIFAKMQLYFSFFFLTGRLVVTLQMLNVAAGW